MAMITRGAYRFLAVDGTEGEKIIEAREGKMNTSNKTKKEGGETR